MRWGRLKFGLRAKVSIWSGVAVVWVIILGGVGLLFIDRVASVSLSLVNTQAVPMIEVGRIKGTVWEIYLRAILHAGLTNAVEMDKLAREVVDLSDQLRKQTEQYGKASGISPEWLKLFQGRWNQFQAIADKAQALSRTYAKEEAMQLLFVEGNQAFEQILAVLRNEDTGHWREMTVLRNEASMTQARALEWVMGITGLFGLMVVVGWWYAHRLSRSLSRVASELATSVAQMSATINAQERVIAQQAASVTETNATMEELGASARQSAEQADGAVTGAQEAMQAAEQGMVRVTETVRSMENTSERMNAIGRQIQLLSEQTGQIRDITALVADFANETKMLAVNAAVEAVRAGAQGKGFSVLAVETRKLADESKRSVAQINDLVNAIQDVTRSTVQAAEEGGKSVRLGIVITRNTAQSFEQLGQTVGMASEGVQQISLNVRQQSVAIRQVVEAMRSIHEGAQESKLGISQVKTGIQALHEAAQTLRNMT